jgi:hypothetical protein
MSAPGCRDGSSVATACTCRTGPTPAASHCGRGSALTWLTRGPHSHRVSDDRSRVARQSGTRRCPRSPSSRPSNPPPPSSVSVSTTGLTWKSRPHRMSSQHPGFVTARRDYRSHDERKHPAISAQPNTGSNSSLLSAAPRSTPISDPPRPSSDTTVGNDVSAPTPLHRWATPTRISMKELVRRTPWDPGLPPKLNWAAPARSMSRSRCGCGGS